MIASTSHGRFQEQDYRRLADVGIATVREGFRWHLIEPTPGKYDFSSALAMLEVADKCGITVIWDLLHFGWPDHTDIFTAAWVNSFSEFTRKLTSILSGRILLAPVNEISFLAWAGGDVQYVNPFATGRGPELKLQLVRAYLAAAEVVRAELPEALLVAPEPVIHIAGNPLKPGDTEEAEAYRRSMFEAWDMITGRMHPELGGKESLLDIIGINYYDRNQWWNHSSTIRVGEPGYRPFHQILLEVYNRYKLPLFIAETGTEGDARPAWFRYISDECSRALAEGVPLHGLCLYPILNHPGWDDDRHCHNGLWDYAHADGSRDRYEPLARELQKFEVLTPT